MILIHKKKIENNKSSIFFSTTDDIQRINHMPENTKEYRQPLWCFLTTRKPSNQWELYLCQLSHFFFIHFGLKRRKLLMRPGGRLHPIHAQNAFMVAILYLFYVQRNITLFALKNVLKYHMKCFITSIIELHFEKKSQMEMSS